MNFQGYLPLSQTSGQKNELYMHFKCIKILLELKHMRILVRNGQIC